MGRGIIFFQNVWYDIALNSFPLNHACRLIFIFESKHQKHEYEKDDFYNCFSIKKK